MINVRHKIRALRLHKGLTGNYMAKRLGISRPFYTQIEGGKRRLTVEKLEKIAGALGVPIADLFGDDFQIEQKEMRFEREKHIRVINTRELRRRLEPLLGEHIGDFVDCFQLWLRTPNDLKRKLKASSASSEG